jgi:Icc-related predicted phosphoesterase
MRIVAISDTHNAPPAELPDGDVLIHCGDFTNFGDPSELAAFNRWLAEQPHKHKIVVPGNHDLSFEDEPELAQMFITEAEVLIDQLLYIEGVGFYGTPWTNKFGDWAFMYKPNERDPFFDAPQADVVISHGPRYDVLDVNDYGEAHGSVQLANYLSRCPPKLHVFGHIHEARGVVTRKYLTHPGLVTRETVHANVAFAGNRRQPIFTFDLE